MKRLVLFLDGTWNSDTDSSTTNVVDLRKLVERGIRGEDLQPNADESELRMYYDRGVGTRGRIDKFVGGAIGVGLSENVRQAYRFLCQFHEPDDEIYIFGFSRGAFTARSLAGFVAAAGLLHQATCDADNLQAAWLYYKTPPKQRMPAERARLKTLGKSPPIKFLGVFDTVGALGVPLGLTGAWRGSHDRFHDTKLGSSIKNAFQALAIDEHRGPFVPALFAKPDHHAYERVEQVWFPGVHSDIGGGFALRQAERTRAEVAIRRVTLEWMVSRLLKVTPGFRIAKVGGPQAPVGAPNRNEDGILTNLVTPSYRLVGSQPLIRAPLGKFAPYAMAPPDEPMDESVHISALDLIRQRPDYRPLNLLGALNAIKQGAVSVIGYDGERLPAGALVPLLKDLGSTLPSGDKPDGFDVWPSVQVLEPA